SPECDASLNAVQRYRQHRGLAAFRDLSTGLSRFVKIAHAQIQKNALESHTLIFRVALVLVDVNEGPALDVGLFLGFEQFGADARSEGQPCLRSLAVPPRRQDHSPLA